MKIYAISDLHLGPGQGKGHYASNWIDHQPKIRENWDKRITNEDLILMPGDFSWNKKEEDLFYDYFWIDHRPGTKIMSPGNHDYGIWDTEEKVSEFCKQFQTLNPFKNNVKILKHPTIKTAPRIILVGVEGSQAPNDDYFNTNSGVSSFGKEVESIRFVKELYNLKINLDKAISLKKDNDIVVVMFHYSPFSYSKHTMYESQFSTLIEKYNTNLCIYGHLHHNDQLEKAYQGNKNGCEYRMVGADFLKFNPTFLGTWNNNGLSLEKPEVVGKDHKKKMVIHYV